MAVKSASSSSPSSSSVSVLTLTIISVEEGSETVEKIRGILKKAEQDLLMLGASLNEKVVCTVRNDFQQLNPAKESCSEQRTLALVRTQSKGRPLERAQSGGRSLDRAQSGGRSIVRAQSGGRSLEGNQLVPAEASLSSQVALTKNLSEIVAISEKKLPVNLYASSTGEFYGVYS